MLKQYILKGYAVNDNRIKQLGEVIRIMKRTENELDSKQVLSVIEKYSNALDLLDCYDHHFKENIAACIWHLFVSIEPGYLEQCFDECVYWDRRTTNLYWRELPSGLIYHVDIIREKCNACFFVL